MKNGYAINNNNQLLIKSPKMKKQLATNGVFGIAKSNRLIFWLNEPVFWRRLYGLPKKIIFSGSWQLDRNHDLKLILDKSKSQFQNEILVLRGNIISTDRDILAFEIKSYDRRGLLHIQILKLSVTCLADETNRLSFRIKKSPPDILTLAGTWQINRNQQITYTYEKIERKRKTKISQTLVFEGYWQITGADRLTYILSHSSKSRFDFRVQLESPNLYPEQGVIKYRIGIGVRKEGQQPYKVIYLYGTWKFDRNIGLIFQMDYGEGKVQSIEFGANVHLNRKEEIAFSLTDKRKHPLGICITFTHKFLKKHAAQTFLRLKKYQEEFGIEAGVNFPF